MDSYNIGPVIIPEFLSAEECQRLRDYFEGAEKISGRLRADSEAAQRIRSSTIAWLTEAEEVWIYEKVRDLIMKINDENYRFEILSLQPMQLTQYQATGAHSGEFYSSHVDICMAAIGTQRKLSLSVQLSSSEEYDGGDLLLFGDENERITNPSSLREKQFRRRQLGTAILFPSFFVHEVTPVTRGARFSLVAWMEGPNWK